MSGVTAPSQSATNSALPPETLASLNALFPQPALPGLIELRMIYRVRDAKPTEQSWLPHVNDIASMTNKLLVANAAGFNIYFGPGLRRARSGKEEDVTAVPAIWADVDAKDFDPDDVENGKRLALEVIRTKLPPELQPSIIVDTGHGYHPYWSLSNLLLLDSETQRQRVRSIMAGLGDRLNGDAVYDLGRVLRLPGTLNVKDPAKPRPCVIVDADYDRRFEIATFDSFAISLDRMRRAESVVFNATMPAIDMGALRISDRIRSLIQVGKTAGDRYPSRSEADAAVAAALANGKHTDDEIRAVFSNPEWRIGERYRERGDVYLQRTIGKARDFVAAHPLTPPPPPSATTSPPRPLSIALSTLLSAEFPEPKFLVKGLIRAMSKGWFGGEAKHLKSMLAIYIALAMAAGEPVFDHFEVPEAVRVLFVEEEDDHGLLKTRLMQFKSAWRGRWPSDENFRLVVRAGIGIDPSKPEDDDANGAFLALLGEIRNFRPGITFIDVFNLIHSGDENSAKDMRRVMARLGSICDEFGSSLIVLHHFNKLSVGKSGRANQRLRGSSVLPGWSENSLYVLKRDRDDILTIEPESKHGSLQPFAVQLEEVPAEGGRHGLRFIYKGDPVGRKQAENRERVFTALTDLQATPDVCTSKALADRLGMSESGVRNCLHELEDQKRVGYTPSKIGGKGQAQHVWHPLINPDKDAQSHA